MKFHFSRYRVPVVNFLTAVATEVNKDVNSKAKTRTLFSQDEDINKDKDKDKNFS